MRTLVNALVACLSLSCWASACGTSTSGGSGDGGASQDAGGDAFVAADGLTTGCGCPTAGLPIGSGVCGGDQKTYGSACLAACAGVKIIDGCQCGRADGSTCGCNYQADLICGDDGRTWTNACRASWSGVTVTSIGACGTGAQHGTLAVGSSCELDHDLCGESSRCCVMSGGLPGDAAPPPPTCQLLENGSCPMRA